MKRKEIVDFITAGILVVVGALVLIMPLIKLTNVKYILMFILGFTGVMNLVKFLLTNKSRDYEGMFTAIASIVDLLILGLIDTSSPLNLALVIFVWVIMMSLIKLKKCDYYHDREKKIWLLRIITLIIFVISGLLCVINLYYEPSVQVLIIGFFFLINGILELIDPITNYLVRIE